jgi:hypothetical protein
MFWRRSLTRLEMAGYAALVGVVMAVFLERVVGQMELAERAAMEITVNQVNSAISLRLAYERLQGHRVDVAAALQRNPFELANAKHPNFLGAVPDLVGQERATGGWVFDLSRRELVYIPRFTRGLRVQEGPADLIRFKLARTGPESYVLVPATKYEWD